MTTEDKRLGDGCRISGIFIVISISDFLLSDVKKREVGISHDAVCVSLTDMDTNLRVAVIFPPIILGGGGSFKNSPNPQESI